MSLRERVLMENEKLHYRRVDLLVLEIIFAVDLFKGVSKY
jgi:hypothetical protein